MRFAARCGGENHDAVRNPAKERDALTGRLIKTFQRAAGEFPRFMSAFGLGLHPDLACI